MQEHIGPFDPFQECFAVRSAGHGITEGTGETAQHARFKEKELKRLGLGSKDLGDKIGEQMTMLTGERPQEALRLLLRFLSEQGKRQQVQTGDPTFCAPGNLLNGRS